MLPIVANAYQINDLKKINESMVRNLKNKENDCSKLLTDGININTYIYMNMRLKLNID